MTFANSFPLEYITQIYESDVYLHPKLPLNNDDFAFKFAITDVTDFFAMTKKAFSEIYKDDHKKRELETATGAELLERRIREFRDFEDNEENIDDGNYSVFFIFSNAYKTSLKRETTMRRGKTKRNTIK